MFRRWQLEVDCRGIMGTRLQKSPEQQQSCIFSWHSSAAARPSAWKSRSRAATASFPNSFFAYAYNSAWLMQNLRPFVGSSSATRGILCFTSMYLLVSCNFEISRYSFLDIIITHYFFIPHLTLCKKLGVS